MERYGSRLSRRQFMAGAGVSSAALLAGCARWPGQAQAPAKVPKIGVLGDEPTARWDAFQQGLRELGWVEGQNLVVEYRWLEGNTEQSQPFAAGLVEVPVECLVVGTLRYATVAKQVTSTVPIVAILATGEALENGLVDNIARPGGNITGTAGISGAQLEGKQLQLLKETVPQAARVAILAHVSGPAFEVRWQGLQSAATALGVQLQLVSVERPRDLEGAFSAVGTGRADALKIVAGVGLDSAWPQIADLALRYRLPAITEYLEFPRSGGLMAYGVDRLDIYRRAATYVDKILKGAQPGDLPMERPMRFDCGVNLKTAQALGITFPNEIMLQVTEVVQ